MSGDFRPTPPTSPTDSPDDFVLTLWTADPALALAAEDAGVDRVGVDLERNGKAERQRGLGTWLSPHTERDLDRLKSVLTTSKLFARVNPLSPESPREIQRVLDAGAEVLMLPMVATPAEVTRFVELVAGRAVTVLLIERAVALERLPELVAVAGVNEAHIGLNDLALCLGLANRWLVLAGELAATAGATVKGAGLRFGLGGIGRAGDSDLPVPSDLVYAEYARTGATSALLSRSFFRLGVHDLRAEVARARAALAAWRDRSPSEIEAAHLELESRARRADCW